ncbi:hypothetical protein [Psychrobacter sp. LV10R520-6]|nr:hypothetical protein [Psychrobacter sp. LV10R520-6]
MLSISNQKEVSSKPSIAERSNVNLDADTAITDKDFSEEAKNILYRESAD